MRKLLVPIVAFLAFSVLCTTAVAPTGEYFIRFSGSAAGYCYVSFGLDNGVLQGIPTPNGKGRFDVDGLAIGVEMAPASASSQLTVIMNGDGYFSGQFLRLRAWLRLRLGSEMFIVYMRSGNTGGEFYPDSDEFNIFGLEFSGWYRDGSAPLEPIEGWADVEIYYTGVCFWSARITLYKSIPNVFVEDSLSIEWAGDGPLRAHGFSHRVTVWPRGWPGWD